MFLQIFPLKRNMLLQQFISGPSIVMANRSKPFADGEFVKKCFYRLDVMCPEKKEQFEK